MFPLKFAILTPLSTILLWDADITTPRLFEGEVLFKIATKAPTLKDI